CRAVRFQSRPQGGLDRHQGDLRLGGWQQKEEQNATPEKSGEECCPGSRSRLAVCAIEWSQVITTELRIRSFTLPSPSIDGGRHRGGGSRWFAPQPRDAASSGIGAPLCGSWATAWPGGWRMVTCSASTPRCL